MVAKDKVPVLKRSTREGKATKGRGKPLQGGQQNKSKVPTAKKTTPNVIAKERQAGDEADEMEETVYLSASFFKFITAEDPWFHYALGQPGVDSELSQEQIGILVTGFDIDIDKLFEQGIIISSAAEAKLTTQAQSEPEIIAAVASRPKAKATVGKFTANHSKQTKLMANAVEAEAEEQASDTEAALEPRHRFTPQELSATPRIRMTGKGDRGMRESPAGEESPEKCCDHSIDEDDGRGDHSCAESYDTLGFADADGCQLVTDSNDIVFEVEADDGSDEGTVARAAVAAAAVASRAARAVAAAASWQDDESDLEVVLTLD